MNRSQKLLLLSAGLVILSWVVPILSLITLPLQFLYTHLHEMGHAIVAAGTGGESIRIIVNNDGSGLTTSLGGSQLLLSPAGYIGATIMGAVVLGMCRSERGARLALYGLSGALALDLLMWTLGGVVGLVTLVGFIVLLFAAGRFLKGDTLRVTAQFLGMYQCLASLQAAFSIIGVGQVALQENDAVILQHATGIPAILSAMVWAAISAASVYLTIRWSWKAESHQSAH